MVVFWELKNTLLYMVVFFWAEHALSYVVIFVGSKCRTIQTWSFLSAQNAHLTLPAPKVGECTTTLTIRPRRLCWYNWPCFYSTRECDALTSSSAGSDANLTPPSQIFWEGGIQDMSWCHTVQVGVPAVESAWHRSDHLSACGSQHWQHVQRLTMKSCFANENHLLSTCTRVHSKFTFLNINKHDHYLCHLSLILFQIRRWSRKEPPLLHTSRYWYCTTKECLRDDFMINTLPGCLYTLKCYLLKHGG